MTEIRSEGHLALGRLIIGGRVYSSQHPFGLFHGELRPAPPPAEPETIMGIEVEKTFTIRESEPLSGGTRLYELHVDGQLVWSGAGDDRVDALLDAIQAATGDDDPPNT